MKSRKKISKSSVTFTGLQLMLHSSGTIFLAYTVKLTVSPVWCQSYLHCTSWIMVRVVSSGKGKNRVYCNFWHKRESATRCFLPDQKILFLAKVIKFWNLENTGSYSARLNFKRDFPKMDTFWNWKIYLLLKMCKNS